MNRRIIAGVLGLALAGCAQSRSVIPRNAVPPVGLTTFPTLNQEISRETADERNRLGGGRTSLPPGLADSTPPARDATPGTEPEPSHPQMAVSPPVESDPTVATATTAPPAEPGPESPAPRAETPTPAPMTTEAGPESTMPAPAPALTPTPAPDAASDPAVGAAAVSVPPTLGAESEPGPSLPPSEPAPALPTGPTEAPTAPAGEALPPLPTVSDLPELPPAIAEPSPAPTPAAMPEGMPAAMPEAMPPAETSTPIPAPAPSTDAGPRPQAATEPEALPTIDLPPLPPEVAPAPASVPAPAPAPTPAPAPGASASATAVDPEVQLAAARNEPDPTQVRSEVRPRALGAAGKVAARVGDEIITMHEVEVAFRERCRMMNIPPGEKLTDDQKNMIATAVLTDLIERSMIIQEAKRKMGKKPEQMKMLTDVADRVWKEEELPPLLKRSASANEYELREKMTEQGESYDDLREAFRQKFIAHGYLDHMLGDKMKVSKHEMLAYYNAHLTDFDRPAQVTWREVVVEVGKCPSQAEARQKADAILQRLTRGEDFTTVAKAESDGPNKADGGLWKTSPGSYNVESVNAALERLEIGQVSQLVEGPTSYHILVVESRRPAGPAPFYEHEVQDKVHRLVRNQKVQQISDDYLAKLRKQTVITTIFDGTEYEPRVASTPDASRTSR